MKANATGCLESCRSVPSSEAGRNSECDHMNADTLTRARRYLAGIPAAIAGSGGDIATYKAAAALVKGFDLPEPEAMPLMLEWNTACMPPWTEGQLRAKLASAARGASPSGYLMRDHASPVECGAEKPAKRRQWPAFRSATPADLAHIAALRGVSMDAAGLIASLGHVWRCRWRGEECLAIRSGIFAQARRMDGQPFTRQDGSTVKALNLPGSEGSFLNPGGMGTDDVPVIITEGAVSILEAAEAILRADSTAGRLLSVAVLAAVSASSRFTAGHLTKFAGRRVRIIPDADPAGQAAAAHWTASLRAAGCTVDAIRLPAGLKDLGDALRDIPAGDSFWPQLLTF